MATSGSNAPLRFSTLKQILAAVSLSFGLAISASAQGASPVIVQPGAPGQPSKLLPANTRAVLPALAAKDVEFMQGMIMHHAQAVEMTALINSRTRNEALRLLGARISQSQSDEINFMKRWLTNRGQETSMPMGDMKMSGMDMSDMKMSDMKMSGHDHSKMMLMPGMLTPEQMEALRNSKGAEFDHLFLTGMIQHHTGALTMVKDLFDTPGSGQDGEIFNFASDVDSGQRAEIRIMQGMLGEHPK